MIKTKVNCKVCQTILDQPKKWEGRLAKRIYGSRYYMPSSTYHLADVAREYADKFGYESLMNHCKKHQALTEDDFNQRHLRQLAAQAEKKLLKDAISSQTVWDGVIKKGMTRLAEGKMEINANHLLSAARDKSSYELKHADQQIAMMDMVYHFASGEEMPEGTQSESIIEGEVVTPGATDDFEARAERSSAFYQSLAGDAPTPGPN